MFTLIIIIIIITTTLTFLPMGATFSTGQLPRPSHTPRPPPADWQRETTTHTGGKHFRWPIRLSLGGNYKNNSLSVPSVVPLLSHGSLRAGAERQRERSVPASLRVNGSRRSVLFFFPRVRRLEGVFRSDRGAVENKHTHTHTHSLSHTHTNGVEGERKCVFSWRGRKDAKK